jgi:hypothetical protein
MKSYKLGMSKKETIIVQGTEIAVISSKSDGKFQWQNVFYQCFGRTVGFIIYRIKIWN